ncbi:MAG: tRNA (guanosine(37)-N1)-methyltransferase TrmD [Candidatus Levybacteria bacterium RIFCSPHIGHO2_01_FULL_40_15b]|nr:MAG: tRNA (guanosine(37)-N1)-methyltransferase TrmD [Candidatus Levybacteria bacterium RIFCSPHIGHO2_01_FULL_40_15b]
MVISIITLFQQIFRETFSVSIIKRAQDKNKLKINFVDLREFGIGKHKMVDDRPYGGGAGMVLRVDVLDKAISSVRTKKNEAVILLDPKGQRYDQNLARELSHFDHLVLICGRYEGFDERVRDLVDYEISIGDYILSGGESAAIVLVDSIVRLIPDVIKKSEAIALESFGKNYILEHPHYTRPSVFRGKKVPEVLLSGNFAEIEKYRTQEAQKLTRKRRPDMLVNY